MSNNKVKPQRLLLMSDSEFDEVYPDRIQKLSDIHWTPIEVARIAIEWLELDENSHLLDIGSGVGKFCCIAAEMTNAMITGVEKRTNLVRVAEKVIKEKNLNNVRIINENITKIDFKNFNAFY
jgi:cyclopropane fatty-acyl-phospholipid synthase-like methyltransferase